MSTRPPAPPPPSGESPDFLDQTLRNALGAFLKALSLAVPVIAAGVFLREGFTLLTLVTCALSVAVWISLALALRGRVMAAAHVVIFSVLLTSVFGVVADGSVRSAAMLVMIAGVVAAGAFLPRRSMIVAAGFSLLALAGLNLAEMLGLLRTPHLKAGWVVWLTQTVVLMSVLLAVVHGRQRTLDAITGLQAALERARQVEAELRASQNRFQSLFQRNPAATLVQRLSTREVIDTNGAFERTFGYRRDELIGQPLPNLWATAAERQVFRDRLLRDGHVHAQRTRGMHLDGTTFEALVYSELINEAHERFIITMVLDVSAEAASRKALEASEERFSKAFNFSPLGMTITRLSDGRFMEVNAANERVLGYSRADFQDQTTLGAGVWVEQADRQAFVRGLQHHGRLEGYETRMRAKSGEVVPVRIWSEIIGIDGEPCALSFTLNVAEEKRREALLLNVAEGVAGDTGEAFFRSLVRNLGQTIGADGVMVGEVDDQHQLHSLALLWDEALQTGGTHPLADTLCEQALHQPGMLLESPLSGRLPLVPPFREVGVRAFLGLPLRDGDGSIAGLITAVWRDPPELQENLQALLTIFASRCEAELVRLRRDREIRKLQDTLEQRVEQRTEQLEYLNRELDSFAYTVSHDLKSPLRSIDGFTHLLREQMADRLTEDDHMLFERVEASVQRMTSLITDLLALARVSQGSLQRTEVDISAMAEDVIRQERLRDPARAVQVRIGTGLRANCDARLARIVLENLIGNAWKYTRHKADATIELGALKRPPGQAPSFYARDNGAGFDMARIDRLFKPFNRLHGASEFEGSGVGLATVRRIIERHGGHIRGEGRVGQGAVFEFSFGRNNAA